MRLKFWDKFNKRWINTASLELSTLGEIIAVRDFGGTIYGPNQFETVRSTGLKDKNGKEIYEGNIVKSRGYYQHSYINREVLWYRGGWCLSCELNSTDSDAYPYLDPIAQKGEVIGNIRDNPELIKEK